VTYTTNMMESVNYQPRKAFKTRSHFPDDDAALKLLRRINGHELVPRVRASATFDCNPQERSDTNTGSVAA
jgi:transposase-like protein